MVAVGSRSRRVPQNAPHADPLHKGGGAQGARRSAVLLASIGVALTLGATASAAGPAPAFGGPTNYPTGPVPNSVAFGDLNGDGKLDLAIANAGAGYGNKAVGKTVSVLLNGGGGRFTARRDYGTGVSPVSVAIGDLNGDGKPDLATANEDGSTVSVLLNNGDGSFQTKRDFAIGGLPYSVAIGDLNGDGRRDLASANTGDGTVSVLLNRGDGSFEDKRDYRTGRNPGSVTIGDLNGDGNPDLAVGDANAGTISVLVNTGDGSFEAKRDYQAGRGTSSVVIGDLNGDGKPDLATAHAAAADTISVLTNTGAGSFEAKRDYRTGSSPFSVAIGDLNGDRTPDLVTANDDARSVSVFANRGNGSFEPKRDYRTGPPDAGPVSVALGDVNGDGRPDLATANQRVASVSVLLNTPGLCNVQNVMRMTLAGAKSALARVNCRLGKVNTAYSKRVRRGRVVSQQPTFGAVLPKGSKVNLVVSRGRKG
jgi:hypothetical protein